MGPRVVVTGAAGGIGAATVGALRQRGAAVVGLDLLEDAGVLACDVRDADAVNDAVGRAVERLGGLDALINGAGIGLPQSATAPPGDDALQVLAVNLLGTWRVTAAALPALRASRGRVINLASGLAHVAVPFATAYAISKRGVVAYSDQLRAEIGDQVTVTTIYPGFIRTPIHGPSKAAGLSLSGVAPEEPLSAAADTLVRAVYGPPARDLATTRMGTLGYAALRLLPRAAVDRLVHARLRAAARAGHFDDAPIAADLARRLRG